MEKLNPVQGDNKRFINKFSVALFEFTNILDCTQLIIYSYFWLLNNCYDLSDLCLAVKVRSSQGVDSHINYLSIPA